LGDGLYRIDNIPFFTDLVSYKDVVVAEQLEDAASGFMRFVKVHSRAGHSTFRVKVNTDEESIKSADFLFEFLKERGCSTERAQDRLIAIDVPPMDLADSDMVWKMIALSADENVWNYDVGFTATRPPWERKRSAKSAAAITGS
jgi:hypothetical protein